MRTVAAAKSILAQIASRQAEIDTLTAALDVLGVPTPGRRASIRRKVAAAADIRAAGKPRRPGRPAGRVSTWRANKDRRARKAEQIAIILKEHGRPMPIKQLAAAAREAGIGGLTGIRGLVGAGILKQLGKKGNTRYAFKAMPTTEPAAANGQP